MEVLWFFFSLFFSLLFPYLSVLVFLLWVLHIIYGVFPVLFSFPCLLPLSVASSFPSLSNIQFLIHILFTLTFSPIVIKRTYILSQKKKHHPINYISRAERDVCVRPILAWSVCRVAVASLHLGQNSQKKPSGPASSSLKLSRCPPSRWDPNPLASTQTPKICWSTPGPKREKKEPKMKMKSTIRQHRQHPLISAAIALSAIIVTTLILFWSYGGSFSRYQHQRPYSKYRLAVRPKEGVRHLPRLRQLRAESVRQQQEQQLVPHSTAHAAAADSGFGNQQHDVAGDAVDAVSITPS